MSAEEIRRAMSETLRIRAAVGLASPFADAAPPAVIRAAEAAVGFAFDEDLRALYALHDGSKGETCVAVVTDSPVGCELLPLARAVAQRRESTASWTVPFHYGGRLVSSDTSLLSVTIEKLGLRDLIMSVIGQMGDSPGLVLFAESTTSRRTWAPPRLPNAANDLRSRRISP